MERSIQGRRNNRPGRTAAPQPKSDTEVGFREKREERAGIVGVGVASTQGSQDPLGEEGWRRFHHLSLPPLLTESMQVLWAPGHPDRRPQVGGSRPRPNAHRDHRTPQSRGGGATFTTLVCPLWLRLGRSGASRGGICVGKQVSFGLDASPRGDVRKPGKWCRAWALAKVV